MLFTSLLKNTNFIEVQQEEQKYTSRIKRITKCLKTVSHVSKRVDDEYTNNKLNNQKEGNKNLSFSNLSKNKDIKNNSGYSICPMNDKISSSKNQTKSKQKKQMEFGSVRRRLDFKSSNDSLSKENKLNFTNIIKNSKEKDLKQNSLSKYGNKKLIKPPIKQSPKENNPFNTMKNRLIKERESFLKKQSDYSKIKEVPPQKQHEFHQMVRMSMHSQLNEHQQLDMNPSL